ncbi:MAG: hypothetical protein JSU96_17530 [Acidobacteriota bacterium]|nr:MAG: hypothetical protein JSU96_17530 [Acidobacteriota bacterium]
MIAAQEKNDVDPVCPHCKATIRQVWFRELGGILGKRYIYFCSACRACLGISHRKGFWMG